MSREGKSVGAVSHGSGTCACNKDFTLCSAFSPLSVRAAETREACSFCVTTAVGSYKKSQCSMLEIMSLSSSLSPSHLISGLMKHFSLVSSQECQDWWAAGCRQNVSVLPANCTFCSAVKSLQVATDFAELPEKLQRSQPFLIKVMHGFVRLD